MQRAAITRIYESRELLELWLSYYSRYFNSLYVIVCQAKDKDRFRDLQDKYGFNEIHHHNDIYSEGAHGQVFDLQKDLLSVNEWVIYSDVDEYVFTDKYEDLTEFMDKCKEEQTFCVGYEVVKANDEYPIDYTKPYLMQRKYWVKDATASYHKPLLSRIPTNWDFGFHHIRGWSKEQIEQAPDSGLKLLHLKHADPEGIYDSKPHETGTHQTLSAEVDGAELIPENIRGLF